MSDAGHLLLPVSGAVQRRLRARPRQKLQGEGGGEEEGHPLQVFAWEEDRIGKLLLRLVLPSSFQISKSPVVHFDRDADDDAKYIKKYVDEGD